MSHVSQGHRVFAAAKNVVLITQQVTFATLDINAWTQTLVPSGGTIIGDPPTQMREQFDRARLAQAVRPGAWQYVDRTDTHSVPVLTPLPREGLWTRLWKALRS